MISHRARESEVLPLTQRAAVMMAFRGLLIAVLVPLTAVTDSALVGGVIAVAAGHLLATGALSLMVRPAPRRVAIRCFGAALLLDALILQYVDVVLGRSSGVELAMAAELVAVCLIASFRTGLKIGLWQSLLLICVVRAEQVGLLDHSEPVRSLPGEQASVVAVVLLWLVLVTTAAASAMSERELRRRRYDAQVLAGFATALNAVDHPVEVAARLLRLAVDELGATRVLVCEAGAGRPHLVCGHGLTPAPGAPAPVAVAEVPVAVAVAEVPVAATSSDACPVGSALLAEPVQADGAVLAMRLDPARDPWLHQLLPGARRLVAVPLTGSPLSGPDDARWLVFEHGARTGSRVERRIVATAVQAAATAALAHSRAVLLQQMRAAATVDGLTGVPNRRSFDGELARLVSRWRTDGDGAALVLVDVDRFKSINDRWGHLVGDQVLRAMARTLASVAPDRCLVARYGGEEFALLVPDADLDAAAAVAERARIALHGITSPAPVTASFGVAALPHHEPGQAGSAERDVRPDGAGTAPAPGDPNLGAGRPPGVPLPRGAWQPPRREPAVDQVAALLIADADAALFRAKADGRDRVRLAPVPTVVRSPV